MKSIIQIVDFYAEKYSAEKINGEYMWKLCSKFLHIIQDTGGLPRVLQYMLTLCFEELNTEGEFFRKISEQDFGNISRLTANKLQSLYGIYNTIRASNKIAWELLYHCVMEKLVAPGDCLDPNNKTDTIENLETETHVILKESKKPGHYYIEMPFLFVVLYNDILRIVPIKQDWEIFVAFYEAFINNMLFEREEKSEVTLEELYRGAHGKNETLNKIVELKKLHVCQSMQQFPCSNITSLHDNKPIKWEEGNDLVVNGKGAPFGDSFVARKILHDPENFNALMITQDKWDYNGKSLTKLEVIKESIKNLKSLVKKSESIINYHDPCCITIIVTTRKYNFDYGQLPEDVLVIDKTNFEKYFGRIFSSRAAFFLDKDINPNFSELAKIKNIVPDIGEVTAGKIAEKRPYYNLNDFLDKHQGIKRQKLDEANIKLDFFPFDL
ncbi:hypothetical protein RclHR1_06720004 [Rhizophagus clarus]|nr:hypothetical protein RclHR1_06720004 [Rhizophagus clarus]